MDLSSPIGLSVNAGISKEWYSIACITVDVVTAQKVRAWRGALMAKFDLKSAYRNVPVHPDDRWLLGMSLYVDVALPFGLRSAPKMFYAVAFLIQQKGVRWLEHYFDDFVLVGPPRSLQCGQDLQVALDVCEVVGMPVAGPKTVGPATVLPLLGIEVDSEALEVRLPPGKLDKLWGLVRRWKHRKCCTKRELQSLAGSLNNAFKVFLEARVDLVLTASHIAGVDNRAADAISRNELHVFFASVPQAERVPCLVPSGLVGRLVPQLHWTSATWRSWLESLLMPP